MNFNYAPIGTAIIQLSAFHWLEKNIDYWYHQLLLWKFVQTLIRISKQCFGFIVPAMMTQWGTKNTKNLRISLQFLCMVIISAIIINLNIHLSFKEVSCKKKS